MDAWLQMSCFFILLARKTSFFHHLFTLGSIQSSLFMSNQYTVQLQSLKSDQFFWIFKVLSLIKQCIHRDKEYEWERENNNNSKTLIYWYVSYSPVVLITTVSFNPGTQVSSLVGKHHDEPPAALPANTIITGQIHTLSTATPTDTICPNTHKHTCNHPKTSRPCFSLARNTMFTITMLQRENLSWFYHHYKHLFPLYHPVLQSFSFVCFWVLQQANLVHHSSSGCAARPLRCIACLSAT